MEILPFLRYLTYLKYFKMQEGINLKEHPKSRNSISERSSILKASAIQQLLHPESPSTTKQKRRVSFAGKKHVKEFCDSVEQGTVWDNTYEESSHEYSDQFELNKQYYKTVNNDHHGTNADGVSSKNESIMSLDLTEPLEPAINKLVPIICQSTDKNGDNYSTSSESNPNIGIYADKGIVVYNDTSSSNDIEHEELNKTCIEDISMEVTEIPCVIKSQNVVSTTYKELLENKENIPISNIINKSSLLSTLQNELNTPDKTQYFFTEQLEFTECLRSITKLPELQPKPSKINQLVGDVINQETQIFPNTSMKITHDTPLISRKNCTDHKIIFHDTSMDNTMIVPSSQIQNNKIELLDTSVADAIYSLPHPKTIDNVTDTVNILNCESSNVPHNKTTRVQNDSMEFTMPAINLLQINNTKQKLPQTAKLNQCTMLNQTRSSESRKIFQNESMAITAPVRIANTLQKDIQNLDDLMENSFGNNQDITSSGTNIFQNESMTITAPVRIANTLQQDIQNMDDLMENSFGNNQDITSSGTKIFQNESMAITAPVRIANTLQQDIQNLDDLMGNSFGNNQDITSSGTKIFQNESMAITAPLCTANTLQQDIQKSDDFMENSFENNEDTMSSRTKIFQNESMAITVPLQTVNTLQQDIQTLDDLMENSFESNQDTTSPSTKIFQNESMAITAPLHTANILQQHIQKSNDLPENLLGNNQNITSSNANILRNESMEISNAIANLPILCGLEKLSESTERGYVNSDIIEKKDETFINNKFIHKTVNDTLNSSATNYIENVEKSSREVQPVCGLTSLISSFVYADMIEEDSFVKAINEDELQSMKSDILEETTCQQNKMNTKSVTDTINVEVINTQFSDKFITRNDGISGEVNHVTLSEKLEESSPSQQGTFSSLVQQLKIYSQSDDCIWELYFENIDKQLLAVGFINTSLLLVIFTQNDVDTATCAIKRIDLISRLENDENMLLSIAHKLLLDKINVEHLNRLFKYDKDVIPLLNYISEDVILILDFIFDLRRLHNTHLMEINTERITFIVRSKYTDIILKVIMNLKLFDKIDPSDINVICILGSVREKDIKELIINIKKDHKFLRRYMCDIKDYIDIIEQVDLANKDRCY